MRNLLEKFNEFLSKYDKVHSDLQQFKKFNPYLLTRIIQLECDTVNSSQYSRRETIELNPVSADITEDVLEENICKALSPTGVNVAPNDLHICHQMKRLVATSNFRLLTIRQHSATRKHLFLYPQGYRSGLRKPKKDKHQH